MPTPGWLSRQFAAIKQESKSWPAWMRGGNATEGEQAIPSDSAKLAELLKAVEPFVRTAKGIPHNWCSQCVLTFEELPSGTRRLNSLKEVDPDHWPTIEDWRQLKTLADTLGGKATE